MDISILLRILFTTNLSESKLKNTNICLLISKRFYATIDKSVDELPL